MDRNRRRSRIAAFFALAALLDPAAFAADERANWFDDPFVRVTSAIRDCPPQPGPLITKAEMQAQAHARTERGTRCYESGRCRLPNSYLYDKEIVPRVQKAILADGRFADTSISIEGQRRWVWLKGCVRTKAQADALEKLARRIEDVEQVFSELVVRKQASRPRAG